jgi:hypothetical protein
MLRKLRRRRIRPRRIEPAYGPVCTAADSTDVRIAVLSIVWLNLLVAGNAAAAANPSGPARSAASSTPARNGGPGGDTVAAADASPADTETAAADARLTRLKRLIGSSGLDARTADDKAWVIAYSGEHLDTVAVYVSLYDDYALVQSEVSRMQPTLEQAVEMLRLNYALDLARIAVDDAGVVTAMQQAEIHDLTGPALKQMVEEVARAADRCAGLLAKETPPALPDLTLPPARTLDLPPLIHHA